MSLVKQPILEPSPIVPAICQAFGVMGYFISQKTGKQKTWPTFTLGPDTSPEDIEADIRTFEMLPAGEELLEMMAVALDSAIYEQVDTLWCCRRHHPITNLFMTMCMLMELEPTDILEADIRESDLQSLELIAGFCEKAHLQIMNAGEPQAFLSFLKKFPAMPDGVVVYCDWALAEEEEVLVEQVAMEKKARFVWPQR